MPYESFKLPRRNALPGFSTGSGTSVRSGTGATTYVSEGEWTRFLANDLGLYVEQFGVVARSERGFEIGVSVPSDSPATTSLHHGELVARSNEQLTHGSHAGAAAVSGQSRTRNTSDSLFGGSGFDSSAGRPPRCPAVSGPGRLAHGLPSEVNDVRRQ